MVYLGVEHISTQNFQKVVNILLFCNKTYHIQIDVKLDLVFKTFLKNFKYLSFKIYCFKISKQISPYQTLQNFLQNFTSYFFLNIIQNSFCFWLNDWQRWLWTCYVFHSVCVCAIVVWKEVVDRTNQGHTYIKKVVQWSAMLSGTSSCYLKTTMVEELTIQGGT